MPIVIIIINNANIVSNKIIAPFNTLILIYYGSDYNHSNKYIVSQHFW